jgi:hypothetical protein
MAKKLKPVHPGEVLSEDFMKPYGLSMNKRALDLCVPVTAHRRYRRGATRDHRRYKRYDWRVTSRPPHNFG